MINKRRRIIDENYVPNPSKATHGFSAHPLYRVWENIYSRCYNPRNKKYPIYGGRGVKVCEEWLKDRSTFIKWAIANGWQKGLQVDKDIIAQKMGIPALLYSPEFCSIVTPGQNSEIKSNCRIIEVNGVSKTITQWGKLLGRDERIILRRIKRGWSIERAATEPLISILTPVIRINKDGSEKGYKSKTEAEKLNGLKDGAIAHCLSGRAKTAGGFGWRYKNNN